MSTSTKLLVLAVVVIALLHCGAAMAIDPTPGALQVGDRVWLDLNSDGKQDANEPGINGALLTLGDANGVPFVGTITNPQATRTGGSSTSPTDGYTGFYKFGGLAAGTYTVTLSGVQSGTRSDGGVLPAALQLTSTVLPSSAATVSAQTTTTNSDGTKNYSVKFTITANFLDVDFGFMAATTPTTYHVGNRVWLDNSTSTPNGVQDATEPGINGATVTLTGTSAAGASVSLTTTTGAAPATLPTGTPTGDTYDGYGWYDFVVPAGTYTVTVTGYQSGTTGASKVAVPANLGETYDLDGTATPNAATFTVTNANRYDVDFGYTPNTSKANVNISGHIYYDIDGDGVIDTGEPLLGAKLIALYSGTTTTGTPVTSGVSTSGTFSFTGLAAGTYTVVETNLDNYASTNAIGGTGGAKVNNDTILVVADGANGVTDYPNQDFLDTCTKPGITLVKTGPPTAKVGDTITYTFKIVNGNVLLAKGAYLYDDMLGGTIWQVGSVAPGAVYQFTKTYKVTSADCSSTNGWGGCGGWGGYGGWGFCCTSGGGDWGCGGGGSSTCSLVNTATVTGYVSCYSKVSSTSSWTTSVTGSTSCGGWGGYGGCDSGWGGYGGYGDCDGSYGGWGGGSCYGGYGNYGSYGGCGSYGGYSGGCASKSYSCW